MENKKYNNSRISKWFDASIKKLKEDSFFESIHIEEVLDLDFNSKEDLFLHSIELFKEMCKGIESATLNSWQIYLSIELEDNEDDLNKVMRTKQDMLDNIDLGQNPEIIIYKPFNPLLIPLIEFYRSPLPFKLENLDDSIRCFYKEFRTIEEMKENEPFRRELNFIFHIN